MGKYEKYLLQNLDFDIPISFWVMYLDNFLGREKAEEFYKYLINARDIKRKNDFRNLINNIGFSIYDLSENESLAFISLFKPIDTEIKIAQNMKNKIFEYYKVKNLELLEDIKKLGYSCEFSKLHWRDKNLKDTYQREYVFVIFSENDTYNQFQKKIIKLAKKYNIKDVLITDKMKDKSTIMELKSNIFDVKTSEIKETIKDTTIETVEKYLSNLSGTKVLFKIPYENNKKILNKDLNYLTMKSNYSKEKQEKVRNKNPYSFNSAMIRSSLLNRFRNK